MKKTFVVTIARTYEVSQTYWEIEASSEDEARQLAFDQFDNTEHSLNLVDNDVVDIHEVKLT
jgi:hypothetical protein